MRQADFERRYAASWLLMEQWLVRRRQSARQRKRAAAGPPLATAPLEDRDLPAAFRQLCAQLALARSRQYSPDLIDRLNALVLSGHHVLYGVAARRAPSLLNFVLRGFAQQVRREIGVVSLSAALFFGTFFGLILAILLHPEFAAVVLSSEQMNQMEQMYTPSSHPIGTLRSDTHFTMFGVYIWNNIRIGFQTFAGGFFFGLPTIFFLLYNGIFIGAVAGHLTHVGLGDTFWSFVSGHSPMELTAIVISGAAGLKLGDALLRPGRRSRKQALVENGRVAAGLMLGAALMFFVAAMIEAFWSPLDLPDPLPKYLVGALLWALVFGYLGFAGRGDDPHAT